MDACWQLNNTCADRQCERYGCLTQMLIAERPGVIDRPRMVCPGTPHRKHTRESDPCPLEVGR